MRVSDDRYTRDRNKLDLAWRLIHHEARTFTIRQWTGLSDDRIRKLYRSYCLERGCEAVLRHRGKSPRQAAYFFASTERSFHAVQLASIFMTYGLLTFDDHGVQGRFRLGSLEAGATLCAAFETYRRLHNPRLISFEHAWSLLLALARHEVTLTRCGSCEGMRLHDLIPRKGAPCVNCGSTSAVGLVKDRYPSARNLLPPVSKWGASDRPAVFLDS
jgi:hypothetical protein